MWAAERLSPVGSESLDMLGVEAVAERMADNLVGHYATMPSCGETLQAIVATRCLEDSLHAFTMTIVWSLCKIASTGGNGPKTA